MFGFELLNLGGQGLKVLAFLVVQFGADRGDGLRGGWLGGGLQGSDGALGHGDAGQLVAPIGITAGVFSDDAVTFEDQRAGHDVIEESTVVGDDDERAGVVDEDVFQNVEGFGIEVVGRFVEYQHVGGLGEESRQ